MTLEIRRTKNKGTVIGMRKGSVTSFPADFNGHSRPRKPMRNVSAKQRKRTATLQEKLKILLAKQEELYGQTWCEAGAGIWHHKCPRNRDKNYKLFADHVNTRHVSNPDRFENLQVLCSWCNMFKGSRRIDFRPPEMIAEMKKLDEANQSN